MSMTAATTSSAIRKKITVLCSLRLFSALVTIRPVPLAPPGVFSLREH